jgi:hypothetical protein
MKFFKNKQPRAKRKKLNGPAKKLGRLCGHFNVLPACLPADLSASGFQGASGQAGRTQGLHTQGNISVSKML